MFPNCPLKRANSKMTMKNNNASLVPADIRALSESETHTCTTEAETGRLLSEMRSSSDEIAQLMLRFTDDTPVIDEGVGARRRPTASPGRGGGYQKNRKIFEIRPEEKNAPDPRLDELAAMGLAEYWLKVAEYLGVDAFLGMWRILDANRNTIPQSKGNGCNSMAPSLRPYSGYLRFQKNRFVENLAAQGVPPKEIQRRVQQQLCENISIVHIWRLANKNRIKR